MAVGVSDISHSATNNRRGGLPSAKDRRRPRFVPLGMSFQHIGTPIDSPEVATTHPGYPSGYTISSQQGRPSTSGDPNWTLQRSFSTSNVTDTGLQGADSLQSGAASEKKRNKLGYHRTSVACSHCRRRKIRCIPSSSDAQGRCANCIRLKKECSFISTEQQQSSDSRPRGLGQPHVDSRDPSKSSSPGPSGSSIASKPSPQQFAPLAANVSNMPPPPISGSSVGDGILGSMAGPGQVYDVNHNVPNWMPTGIPPFIDTPATNWNNPWRGRPTESPISEHNPEPPLSPTWAPSVSESATRDMAWGQMPVPVRSFSYSGESLDGPNPAGFMPVQQGGPPERPTYINPSLSMTNIGGGYQAGMESGGTISPVPMSHPSQMQWQQQQNVLPSQGGFSPWGQGYGGSGPQNQLDGVGQPAHPDEATRAAPN